MCSILWLSYALILLSSVHALNSTDSRNVTNTTNILNSNNNNNNIDYIYNNNNNSSKSNQRIVPLLLRNLNLGTISASAESTTKTTIIKKDVNNELSYQSLPIVTIQKVPSRRNASENAVPYTALLNHQPQYIPTNSANNNYNNQQNVQQLVRNIESRLSSIRNVEMRVARIQEIFDSMHFTASGATSMTSNSKNITEMQQQHLSTLAIEHDLEIFSNRLAKKLEKAVHVVLDLRDFFRFNITKLLPQSRNWDNDYNDDTSNDNFNRNDGDTDENPDDIEAEIDREIDEIDGITPAEDIQEYNNLYLDTIIVTFETDDETLDTRTNINNNNNDIEQHYNKQQIQILHYLKTDYTNGNYKKLNRKNINELDQIIEYDDRSLRANAFITDKFDNLKLRYMGNHFKDIYFLSNNDQASDHNEQYSYDMNFRQLLVSSIKYKYVFLLIDVGSATNGESLELAKTFVSSVLNLLIDSDLITIVTIAHEPTLMVLSSYATNAVHGIYYATRDTKDDILLYLSNLSASKSSTNHTLGFQHAFRILESHQNASVITQKNPITFVYITRGLLSNLSDAVHVLTRIADGQASLLEPIIINTCGVVMDEKRLMYEKQFLSDVAAQNYTKYEIDVSGWLPNRLSNQLIGGFFMLTKRQSNALMYASTMIFASSFEERYLTQSWNVHTQVIDTNSKDSIVSITHAVAPFGVVGINLFLSDLIEDVVNYHQQDQFSGKNEFIYAFIIDRNGITLTHPAFPRPITQYQNTFPVDIAFLENSTDFNAIRQKMLQDERGTLTTTVYLSNGRQTQLMHRTYRWQSVLNVYVMCLVSTVDPAVMTPSSATGKAVPTENPLKNPLVMPTSMPITLRGYHPSDDITHFQHTQYEFVPTMDLLYHRLDLLSPMNGHVCRYFRQIATFDVATLFLSSSAFESPFTFLHNNRISSQQTQVRIVESILVYIKDTTNLLVNPGLRPQIRHEVNALYNAMQHLKKRHQDTRGSLRNYIIRRYIATVNGVLQVYPGTLLSNNYDPTRRPWFKKAMEQPGKVITTEPYLDAGGAGHIITIAHTIFEGKSNALHSVERDRPVAIVALDLPYTYYYKLILDTTPLCQMNNIKCLIFEDRGYLLAHPSMLEPSTLEKNQRRPHEHLTHKESYLANDILNHKVLVRKLACANYQNRTLQRYYVFNTSLTDILTNVVQGERTKYAIALVHGSNVFAAVLNSTCDDGAFCPCSTIDRMCLNCKRMDQNECECPCECPMEWEGIFGESALDTLSSPSYSTPFSNYTQQYSYCEPASESFVELPTSDDLTMLHSCLNINCDVYGNQNECLAVMGCEWCQQDLDGNTFSAPFCASQSTCFNGILASLTPYGDFDDLDIIAAHGYGPGQKQNSYSALGPVGGAVIVLAIVIGFAIYCYRHNIDSSVQDQFYMDSMQEENYGLPLSRFNFDDCQRHDDAPGNGYDHLAAQRNLIHPADISPYHVSTGSSYRRPPNGESDHGYSTMTPHEDSSDHQCFTLAEPNSLLLNDKRNSKSDTLSISTTISSPTNRHHHNPHLNPSGSIPQSHSAATKELHYKLTSPTKRMQHHGTAPAKCVFEQTILSLNDSSEEPSAMGQHYILAPVTVHRHMETSES